MEVDNISASGHPNMSQGNLTANMEDWGGTTVRNHIRQQGIQIANNEVEMAHDVTKVHASTDGWDIKAVLLTDGDTEQDELLGELFAADNWRYDDETATVSYYRDKETSQQEEIRKRCCEEVAEKVAEQSDFDEDILSAGSVTIRDQFADRVQFQV